MALTRISADVAQTQAQAVRDAIDAGGEAGTLELQTGPPPASTTDPDATVLARFTLAYPCGAVSGGVLTFAGAPLSATGLASGVAGHARIKNSAGTTITVCDVSDTAGDGAVKLNSTSVTQGQDVLLNSITYTVPTG